MKTETVPIGAIAPLEKNPRRHPEKQLAEICRSIKLFGQYRAIVVDENSTILAGNGLYEALKREGYTKVAIHRISGLTEAQKTKLVLSDNRIAGLASDDFDLIDELLKSIGDFDVPGYDTAMLAELLDDAAMVAAAEEYGKLPQETVEQLQARHDEIEAANSQATAAADEPRPTPSAAPGEQEEGEQPGTSAAVCPTCHRPL